MTTSAQLYTVINIPVASPAHWFSLTDSSVCCSFLSKLFDQVQTAWYLHLDHTQNASVTGIIHLKGITDIFLVRSLVFLPNSSACCSFLSKLFDQVQTACGT